MLGKGLQLKTTVFEKLVNHKIVDHIKKCGFFSDFQYGFRSSRSISDLVTVISDRIDRPFNRSGATRAVGLDISKTGFGMLVYFTKLSLMEYQVRYLALFLLFLVIDCFEWFWMESLHENIQLMMEFLKDPFSVLHFSCCILMTFLMMLSFILLSMSMIPLSFLTVIRDLICGNNLKWLLNLNPIYEILWTGVRNGLLISFNPGKTQLVSFDQANNNGSLDVKMDGSVLEEKSSFKMLVLTFSSKVDRGSYIISVAKTASKKIGALICSMKFLSPEVALYITL